MNNSRREILFAPHFIGLRQKRATRLSDSGAGFLAEIASAAISDRLAAVKRQFDSAVDLFSPFDFMADHLSAASNVRSVKRFPSLSMSADTNRLNTNDVEILVGSRKLPLENASTNLITSVFGLHWTNDLPGLLAQIRNSLTPDGLFMSALPGDRTLQELRNCMIDAESRLTGNISLRVDPFGEVRQYGNLLQRAGFALPVVDSELITARYASLKSLVVDLRAMGATSSIDAPKAPLTREIFDLCEELYFQRYGDPDNKIRATFEIVQLSGWAPHDSQQKPLKPGSAIKSLKDVL